ncbi:serine/threonine protein kinase [Enhygromyxa salina]|uniref:Serine/threonine protein kinase n=1 Tax=Enhygromyxa salina TaxID=215803 RepID=A0A0C2D629_9BACT|nr:serine/threonine-protein kinase [Enhygromyxa salina]KIG17120.1 serine/threonine protein kinase [Enhygromyxa salina]
MRKLGQYTLTTRLGRGGMGSVWKARQRSIAGVSGDVAVKLIHPEQADEPHTRQSFLEEARMCMLLRSSNIVSVFDVAESRSGVFYIVMEWVDGLNLAQLCKKMWEKGETFSDAAIAFIVAEVLKGLMHAHELNEDGTKFSVIHRDVSPHNIIISTRGEIKLLDFGVARISSEETTSPLCAKGKIRYMPPEQLRGKTRHPTVDLFPVGAILHELLDRRKFRVDAIDHVQLYGYALAGMVPPLSEDAVAPSELANLRDRLLSYESHSRPQSAREVFHELIQWPGYRNATFEIEDAVRRHASRTTRGSDTSATYVVNDANPPPEHSDDAPTDRGGGPPAVESHAGPASRGESADPSAKTVPERTSEAQRQHRLVPALLAGLILVGFGLLGVGLWFGPGAWAALRVVNAEYPQQEAAVSEHPAVQPEVRDVDTDAHQEPGATASDEPATMLAVASAPAHVGQPAARHDPGPDQAASASDQRQPTKPKSSKRQPSPPRNVQPEPGPPLVAEVTIRLGAGINWAEVEIGSQTFKLDRFGAGKSVTKSLAVGSHRAKYRTEVGADWTLSGQIKISGDDVDIQLGEAGLVY